MFKAFRSRLWVLTSAAALALLPVSADAVRPNPSQKAARVLFVHRVTGTTPFPDSCGDPAGADATADAEVESHLAINPNDPDHLLASWKQDPYASGGGARSDMVAVSTNGGKAWAGPLPVPGISSCTDPGNIFTRVTDPWGAIGPDGKAYLASLGFATDEAAFPDDAEQVSISPDGGLTWDPEPAAIEVEEKFLEKPEIAADPARPGRAYMIWTVLDGDLGTTTDGYGKFARTEDGGKTWTEPAKVPPDQAGVIEAPWEIFPLARPGGGTSLVAIVSGREIGTGINRVYSVDSDDLGETWSAPSAIATFVETGVRGDPESAHGIGLSIPPSAAVAPDGRLYVTWADETPVGTAPGGTAIRIAHSDDGGKGWTADTIATFPYLAFMPKVAVAGDGTVGVFWYDVRNDIVGVDGLTTDVWLRFSSDKGASWKEIRVEGPFDMRQAPIAGTRLDFGEYAGMVGFPHGFGMLFPMAPPKAVNGASDVFFARVQLPSR